MPFFLKKKELQPVLENPRSFTSIRCFGKERKKPKLYAILAWYRQSAGGSWAGESSAV